MTEFHTIVIGSGSGGLTIAVGLAKLGKQVALTEAGAVGGDCTNVGCVPSKTLIHLVTYPEGRSPEEILAHVQEKRNALRDKETREVKEMDNVTFFAGRAKFLAAQRLEVTLSTGETSELSARNIVVATGSKPRRINIEGLPAARTLTNESLFELSDKPEHLVIVGAAWSAPRWRLLFANSGAALAWSTVLTGFSRRRSRKPPKLLKKR